jgi:ABC-2 type transport system ATP-binding protein
MRVDLRNLTVRFGATTAVDDLSLTLDGSKIYGLLGRNGAGKTSLLAVLSAFRKADAGEIVVNGEDPFENWKITRDICFIRDRIDSQDEDKVSAVLKFAASLRPNWDAAYADKLVRLFNLPLKKKVSALSRGMKSALGITLGLATRAPLTIFDESYLGLDAPSRYAFYDELLADYMANPRMIILSTHLIEEVAPLFEEVVIIDHGRLVLHDEADAVRSRGAAVTGPAEAVDRFVEGLTVLSEQRLGPTKSAMVVGPLDPGRRAAATALNLELGPVALQELFVHLTKEPTQ